MSKKILSPWLRRDLKKLDFEITKLLNDGEKLLSKLAISIFKAGGKRLRPALVLICGRVGKYDFDQIKTTAAVVELIHMASLIHDDVLDKSSLRRGVPTIFNLHGWKRAVTVGDYIFSIAFNVLGSLKNVRVLDIMSKNAMDLSLGELEQMDGIDSAKPDPEKYLERIWKKTASLFSSSCQVGAILSYGEEEEIQCLGEYGKNLGLAFQIYDDILDIIGEEKVTGKNPGIDIVDGNITLPIIYALNSSDQSEELYQIIVTKEKNKSDINKALGIISKSDAIERTRSEARGYIKKALESLDGIKNSEVRKNLSNIGNYVIERYH